MGCRSLRFSRSRRSSRGLAGRRSRIGCGLGRGGLRIEVIARGNQVFSGLLHLERIKRRVAARRRHVVYRRKDRWIFSAWRTTGDQQAQGANKRTNKQGGRRHRPRAKDRPLARRHGSPRLHVCLRYPSKGASRTRVLSHCGDRPRPTPESRQQENPIICIDQPEEHTACQAIVVMCLNKDDALRRQGSSDQGGAKPFESCARGGCASCARGCGARPAIGVV